MKVKTMKKPIKTPEIITGISGKKYAAMNFNSPEFLAPQPTFDDPPYYTKGGIETIDFIDFLHLFTLVYIDIYRFFFVETAHETVPDYFYVFINQINDYLIFIF